MKVTFFCTGEEKPGTDAYQRVMAAMDIEASRHGLVFYQPLIHPDDLYHCCIVSGGSVGAEGIHKNPMLAALQAWQLLNKERASA